MTHVLPNVVKVTLLHRILCADEWNTLYMPADMPTYGFIGKKIYARIYMPAYGHIYDRII